MAKREMFGPQRPYGPYRPVINSGTERVKYIKEDKPAIFQISDRRLPSNAGKRVTMQSLKEEAKDFLRNFASPSAGRSAVQEHDKDILRYSEKYNIDPDLVRAVMYAENARGYYGKPFDALRVTKSALPMNIRKSIWSGLLTGKQQDLYNPDTNIETGVFLLKRIRDRIDNPTPEKVGTLWNSLSQENINKFGEYVGKVYRKKPWKEIE